MKKNSLSRQRKLWSVSLFIDRNKREEIRARISKLLRSPGIESARLGIDIWAPLKVYKYGLRIIPGKAEFKTAGGLGSIRAVGGSLISPTDCMGGNQKIYINKS